MEAHFSPLALQLQYIPQAETSDYDFMVLPTAYPWLELLDLRAFILYCIQLSFFYETSLFTKVVNIKC